MYANGVDEKNKPAFIWNAKFKDSEETYGEREVETGVIDAATIKKDTIYDYNTLTGSNVPDTAEPNSSVYKILNRLPKTWKKADSATVKQVGNKKTLLRLERLDDIDSTISSVTKLKERLSKLSNNNSSTYTIIPKIQTAYGFTDLGSIYENGSAETGLADFDDDGDVTFVTTHKIGYEERDRFAKGENTCNSYLFLSPVNHSEIQVDGDTLDSSKKLKGNESLRVPLIYQYRMTDYDNKIFGKSGLKETSSDVKNTKFANIIGIDIWLDRNYLKPKQYDIIVYSTYGSSIETNTNKTKTSSRQSLINIGSDIVNKLDKLSRDSKTLSKIPSTNLQK